MSFAEILAEIPNLSFAQRQELIRCAVAMHDDELTPEENALLDSRMEEFRRNPTSGIPIEQVRERVAQRIARR